MKYIYGPLYSRRLGRSLGVDPIPMKTCNWNCVYCQLGRSVPLTNVRKDYVPRERILEELNQTLGILDLRQLDWITIAGSGEPLLLASLGWLIRQIKTRTQIPVAVITNGSLLYLPEVREDLMAADAVLPTVNAGSADIYFRVNRPHPEVTFERFVEGLMRFREAYTGQFWPEVMLIKGFNDSDHAMKAIAMLLAKMRPDRIHINLPIRPAAESWVLPPDQERIKRAIAIFGPLAQVIHLPQEQVDISQLGDVLQVIAGIVSRHPLWEEEILAVLPHWQPEKIRAALSTLEARGIIGSVHRQGRQYWCAPKSVFPKLNKDAAKAS